MRRVLLLCVTLVLLAGSGWADGERIGYHPPQLTYNGSGFLAPGVILLPNGTAAAPALSFAEAPGTGIWIVGANNDLKFNVDGAGAAIRFLVNDSEAWFINSLASAAALTPAATDTRNIGDPTKLGKEMYIARGFQGSKPKALAGGVGTAFLRVAVPQTAGANFAGGRIGYTVYAADAADSQSLQGDVRFAAVNKAGTETCTIGEVGTPVLAVSLGGSTLTCTWTCATAAADTVDLSANCASSLVETTFNILYRGDMQQMNTYTPQ